MNASASAVVIAAILGAVGGTLFYFKRAPKLVCWMFLLAGFGITGGLLGETVANIGGKVGDVLTNVTAQLLGVGVPMVIVAVATTWLVVELGPKKKKGGITGIKGMAGEAKKLKRPTPWIALGYASLLAIVGGVSIGTGQDVLVSIGGGMTDFANVLVGGLPAQPVGTVDGKPAPAKPTPAKPTPAQPAPAQPAPAQPAPAAPGAPGGAR